MRGGNGVRSGEVTIERSRPTVTAVVRIVEARRELAQESLRLLFEGLRSGVTQANDLGLRGLGVREDSEIYQRLGVLSHALSALRGGPGAKGSSADERDITCRVESTSIGLREVIAVSRAAAQKTAALTEQVSELLHQQVFALEIAREVLNDSALSEQERMLRLNNFLDKQTRCIHAIRAVNSEVLRTQSFQQPVAETIEKVIDVVDALGEHLADLEEACVEPN